eukprot:6501374-Pyramimonas_sp.AAC.1
MSNLNLVPQIFYDHMRKTHPLEAFRMSLAAKVVKDKRNNTSARARELDPKERKRAIHDVVRLLLYVYMLYLPGYPPEDYAYSFEEFPEWSDFYDKSQLTLQNKHAKRVVIEAQRMLRKLFPDTTNRSQRRSAERELFLVFDRSNALTHVADALSEAIVKLMSVAPDCLTHEKMGTLVLDMFDFVEPGKIQTKKKKYIQWGLERSKVSNNTNVGKAIGATMLPGVHVNDIKNYN